MMDEQQVSAKDEDAFNEFLEKMLHYQNKAINSKTSHAQKYYAGKFEQLQARLVKVAEMMEEAEVDE